MSNMTKMLIAVLMVVGCGGTHAVDRVFYSSDGSIPAALIFAACQLWLDVGVTCEPASDDTANVSITARDIVGAQGLTEDWAYPISVLIDARYADPRIIAHEFGHALGIGHLDAGPAMMNTVIGSDVVALTPIDIAGYDRAHPNIH